MNILQAFKMAWKSIAGKKGRSALTILSIFIGIAAVMTIVSIMEGMKAKSMEQFEAMGTNRITVSIYSWSYDEQGNPLPAPDYFDKLYQFCNSIPDLVIGVTPTASCGATAVYGTKSTAKMEWQYDDNWNVISSPPQQYYGSDQYSACNNLTVGSGRDLAWLDCKGYKQVCVLGAQAAKVFFGSADPVGKELLVNGNAFRIIGVYNARVEPDSSNAYQMDNFIVYPYTASRILGGDNSSQEYLVKARDNETLSEAITEIGTYMRGQVDQMTGGINVYSESQWQQDSNEYMNMISLVLGGIAAISLVVGGIGIMNIMLVSVTERTREIGLRMAVGARRGHIMEQFLMEAVFLCLAGSLAGILLAVAVSGLADLLSTTFPLRIAPDSIILSVVCSSLIGTVFGFVPARNAARLNPIEALARE